MKHHLHSVYSVAAHTKSGSLQQCFTWFDYFAVSLAVKLSCIHPSYTTSMSTHQRRASNSSHDSGYVSGSTSASASTALTRTSRRSHQWQSSTNSSRLLSPKLFRGWVRSYDPVERRGVIQARTGTTYEFDGADVLSPTDRKHVREDMAVVFEARLDQGDFRAEAIQVAWSVVGAHVTPIWVPG